MIIIIVAIVCGGLLFDHSGIFLNKDPSPSQTAAGFSFMERIL